MTSPEKNLDFENLLMYIRQSRGFDFTSYKSSTLMRCIYKRMQSVNLERFTDYIDYLQV